MSSSLSSLFVVPGAGAGCFCGKGLAYNIHNNGKDSDWTYNPNS